jgi:UDP-N-acetylmuramoylalanine--D-glutamate ligase
VRFSQLEGAAVGVWGAGREIASFAGQLARRLPAARIAVAAFDAEPGPAALEGLGAARARIVTGAQVEPGLSACDVVVRSPGVSVHRPELRALRAGGTPVTTATSLWLCEHGPRGVLAVTGTKGKSTTAALAHHLARAAGARAQLAGNIGVPALDLLDEPGAELVVLELSSYQIADLQAGAEVVLITNLYREHTQWHGSEAAYRADKLRLLSLPGVRVLVSDAREGELERALLDPEVGPGGSVLESIERLRYGTPEGWDVRGGAIARHGRPVASAAELGLLGEHNLLNLCGAVTALEALGHRPELPGALRGFTPLAHRLEPVHEGDGVLWVNDSISTTPESTLAALASFAGRQVVLIAGGQDRGQDYEGLARAVVDVGATLIGVPSTGARRVAQARAAGLAGARAREAGDLARAVALARLRAKPGGVVLLSPAAPSFDRYRDFEERGERFSALARER